PRIQLRRLRGGSTMITRKLCRTAAVLGMAAVAALAVAGCSTPFAASDSGGGGDDSATDSDSGEGLTVGEVHLETESELASFFDDESTSELSGDLTITADVEGGSDYNWRVDGEDPADTDSAYFSVSEDPAALTAERSAADFEEEYPVGTVIDVTLVVTVDGSLYSGTRKLEVVESDE
ncbi:MAG: hypothetical protein ACLFSP_05945, partial [Spirochaetaceae bacterium]